MILDRGEIVTKEEQATLLSWICENLYTFNTLRENLIEYTCDSSNSFVPHVVWNIRNRLIEKEGIQKYADSYSNAFFKKFHAGASGVYRDYIAIILHKGNINPHVDANQPGLYHSRYNVFVQVPSSGGETYYGGEKVETKERGYVLCRSGLDMHWVDPIGKGSPRITLSFGFHFPMAVLNTLTGVPTPEESLAQKGLRLFKESINRFINRNDG